MSHSETDSGVQYWDVSKVCAFYIKTTWKFHRSLYFQLSDSSTWTQWDLSTAYMSIQHYGKFNVLSGSNNNNNSKFTLLYRSKKNSVSQPSVCCYTVEDLLVKIFSSTYNIECASKDKHGLQLTKYAPDLVSQWSQITNHNIPLLLIMYKRIRCT